MHVREDVTQSRQYVHFMGRIENLVSYISKKMTYTAGKFVIFCDQTQWLYAPWSEDEDSAVPQVSLLQVSTYSVIYNTLNSLVCYIVL